MPFTDMRAFLDRLEQAGELGRVAVEVDPDHELGAVAYHAVRHDGPALLFESVRGHGVPLVANLLATRQRMAIALDGKVETIVEDWRHRIKDRVPPRVVADAPCQENVLTGDDVDLRELFPIPTFNDLDAGPYITAGCHVSADPDGTRNVGVYRNQVHGPRTLGISAPPYRHIRQHRTAAERAGRPLPLAIAIGVDPAVFLAATASAPAGVDELSLAGAIKGEPVELVECVTIPAQVPASAEIVLECEMPPGAFAEEGPFGEFTGYYASVAPRPLIEVKAVTYRTDPIYHAAYIGHPPNESSRINHVMNAANIMDQVSLPGLRSLCMTEGSSGAQAVAAIDKPFEGYGKMMGLAILGAWAARQIKTLIVVDSDIDPYDPVEVDWAIASRVQADRDVEVLSGLTGMVLDQSLPEHERSAGTARTSKIIIDATRYDADRYRPAVRPRQEVYERVVDGWERYGIRT
jgi:2,5-furandicarboxylate decarboxylase 1